MAELNGEPHTITIANLPQHAAIKIHGFSSPEYNLPEDSVLLFDRLEGIQAFCGVEGSDNEISIDGNTRITEMGGDEYKIEEETQKEALAKRGVDHDKYDVFLEDNSPIYDESTGIKVVRKSDGKSIEAVMGKSRRQLAEKGDTTYLDTIVQLTHELESE